MHSSGWNLAQRLAIWEDDGNPQRRIQWSRNLAARIEPLSGGGAAYVNYLNDDASPDEVKDAYGTEKYRRLRALKAKYDPQNVFRFNQMIARLDEVFMAP